MLVRPDIVVPPRKKLSPVARKRIWDRENGICWWCDEPVPMSGPLVQYDHKQARELFGADADREENLFPIHTRPCHLAKSQGEDWPRINKARRQHRMRLDQARKAAKRPIRSRTSLQSRPFPKVKRPLSRKRKP